LCKLLIFKVLKGICLNFKALKMVLYDGEKCSILCLISLFFIFNRLWFSSKNVSGAHI